MSETPNADPAVKPVKDFQRKECRRPAFHDMDDAGALFEGGLKGVNIKVPAMTESELSFENDVDGPADNKTAERHNVGDDDSSHLFVVVADRPSQIEK